MLSVLYNSHFRPSILVTSLKSLASSILFLMGMDQVLIDFLVRSAVGAGTVLLVLAFVGIRIPRSSSVMRRRPRS